MMTVMKRALLVLVLAAGVAASVGAAAAGPRVVLVDASPVLVMGAGFERGAVVRVTVSLGKTKLSKNVDATSTGRFAARWQRALSDSTCAQIVVTAVSAHRRAVVKTVPAGDGCGAQRASSDPAAPSP